MDREGQLPLVMIADGDDHRRSQVIAVVREQGFRVAESDASRCLEDCERLQPSIVCLSSSLPDGDGFALCEAIHQRFPAQLVFLLLDTVSAEMIERALACGACEYITQPLDNHLLARRLHALVAMPADRSTWEIAVALHDFEQRYKTLFDSAPISIFSKDRIGCYTSANAYNLTYHRPGGPLGFTDADLFPPDVALALRTSDLWVMQTGQELEVEEVIPTVRGVRTVLSRKAPLRNATGEIEGVMGISEDITERKKWETALLESNQRFQALFQHSPDAIFLLEPDEPNLIVDCNEVACRMNGYSREELVGHSIAMLDTDTGFVVPEPGVSYTDWLRQKGYVHYEMMHRHKDGTWFPIEVSTCMVSIGERELILGIDRDISERRQIEAAEREQRNLAEALRDAASALNSTLNLNEVLDRILTQAARVVPHETSSIGLIIDGIVRIVRCRGFAERELEDVALSMHFPLAEHSHYGEMIASRKPIVVADVRHYSGWFVQAEVDWIRGHVATPIIVQDEVIGFLHLDSSLPGTFTEEHARNLEIFASQVGIAIQNAQYADELEQRVRERTAELRCALMRERELSDLKTRFLTMASHEFRTPMSIMMTSSELLWHYYDRMTPEQRQERLFHIQTEIENMTALLENVLKVNRTVDNNHQQVKPEPLNIPLFCENLLAKSGLGRNRPVAFICGPDCGTATLDSNLLTDILTSLLSNAVKYSKTDQPIRFEVACDDDRITFQVEDHGVGIPEEDQERVFEIFHRGSNVNHISGTGLGLTIAKQSAELHGGTLTFTSKLGVGTTFTLVIPKDFLKEGI